MGITTWWKTRIEWHDRCRDQRARLRDAYRFGQKIARYWLAGRGSVVRAMTPGAGDSFVAAAFRHGLVEGTSIQDAAAVAQAVLSGMADAAHNPSRRLRPGSRSLQASQRAAAQRGVDWMAEQVLRGADADYQLGRTTIEKIRSWSLECPFPTPRPSPSRQRRLPDQPVWFGPIA
ncbi:MAG: hypothetical protein JRG80_03425 [Deltaproteobacteria bacterium]|nr:hypothetical protein [Deltaproteobacteria bacterium]